MALLFGFFATAEIGARSVYKPETHHCSTDWEMCAVHLTWCTYIYGVTLPVMTFCYFFVFRAIRQSERRLQTPGNTHTKPVEDSGAFKETAFRNLDSATLGKDLPSGSGYLGTSHSCEISEEGDDGALATMTLTPSTQCDQMDNIEGQVIRRSSSVPANITTTMDSLNPPDGGSLGNLPAKDEEPSSDTVGQNDIPVAAEATKKKWFAVRKRHMKLPVKRNSYHRRVAMTGKCQLFSDLYYSTLMV